MPLSRIGSPGSYTPAQAMAFGQEDQAAVPVSSANPLPVAGGGAPYGAARPLSSGAVAVFPGAAVNIIATAAGLITLNFADGSSVTQPVVVGFQTLPYAVTGYSIPAAGGATVSSVMVLDPATPFVRPPTVYIINPAGQSNGVGPALDVPDPTLDAISDPRVLMWSETGGHAGDPTKAQKLLPFSYPAPFESTQDAGLGPWAHYIRNLLPTIGPQDKIVLLCSAVGGTSVYRGRWSAVTGGDLYARMIAGTQHVIVAFAPGTRFQVVTLWQQGENDLAGGGNANISTTPAQYKTELAAVMTGYRSALALLGITDDVWLAGGMVPSYLTQGITPTYPTGYGQVGVDFEQAQVEVTAEQPRSFWVGAMNQPAGGYANADLIHYSIAAQRNLGALYYAKRLRPLTLTVAPPAQPSNPTLTAEVLSFGASDCSLYAVEYRAAGSSGPWTRVKFHTQFANVQGQPLSVTVPGSGARDARVFALSYAGDSAPSATVSYAVPATPPPTPIIDLNIAGATMSGANVVSISSTGSNTATLVPENSAGTGAAATVTKTSVGTRPALALLTTQSLRGTGNPIPAGSFTIYAAFAQHSPAITGSNWFWSVSDNAGADTPTDCDFAVGLASSGVNAKAAVNGTTAQLVTTGALVTAGKNHCLAWVFDTAAATVTIYLNGVSIGSATIPVRAKIAATAADGWKVAGFGKASNDTGVGVDLFALRAYPGALTAAQIQTAMVSDASAAGGIAWG